MNFQQSTTSVQEPKIFIATGASTTELATNVQTEVNTLVKQYQTPASGQTPGNVVNDSIELHPMSVSITSQGVSTFYCAITWRQYSVPVNG